MKKFQFSPLVLGLVVLIAGGAAFAKSTAAVAPSATYGYVDAIDNDYDRAFYSHQVIGWAYDPNNVNTTVSVHIYIDGTLTSAASASEPRLDVEAALGIGSERGFSIPIPDEYFDGARHTLRAYAVNDTTGSRAELRGSPMSFADYDPGVKGYIDVVSVEDSEGTTIIRGWAFDNSSLATSIPVVVYVDDYTQGQMVGSDMADIARSDVNNAYGAGMYHGFAIPLNLSDYDPGETIHLSAYAVDLTEGELKRLGTIAYTVE